MKVAIYARVNTLTLDANGLSIAAQLTKAEDWCIHNGGEVADIYIETPHTKGRVLNKMMRDARHSFKKFDAIIVHSLSRLTRSLNKLAKVHRCLKDSNISIITVSDDECVKFLESLQLLIYEHSIDSK